MSVLADQNAEPPPTPAGGEVILRLTDVVKTFPGVRALDGVELEVRAGEVHCLLGQNGAGKSTLIKILSGVHRPDTGHIEWFGEPVLFADPQASMKAGIATIYQELDLVEQMTVAENVFLGHEPRRFGFVRRARMRRDTRRVLARLGHPEIPVERVAERLPAAAKQVVSMGRALSREARLLIMDEPSAVLAHDEVANLFRIIRELTGHGIAVVYISHRLEEIREIGDRVSVLKDGRTAATNLPARTTPTRDLVSLMTGRTIEYVFPERPGRREPSGQSPATVSDPGSGWPEGVAGGPDAPGTPAPIPAVAASAGPARTPLLAVTGLTRHGEFHDVSLTLHSGEVVGIAGLVGSGRSELLQTIYGARRAHAGRVEVDGRPLRPGSVGAAVRAGLGMAPEERKSQALLLGEPVYRNITLPSFSRYAVAGFTRADRERAAATRVAAELDLRPLDVRRSAGTLSGGNQQKVVVARWLLGRAGRIGRPGTRLLLLDEPTRGVDVGARAELYQVIRALAERGVGVLLVSSEVPEVLGLADRVLVMREGRMIHEAAARDLDEHTVLDLIMAGSLLEEGLSA